ncbi:hypothetical protein [Streptomyces sp. NPDC005004]
MTGYQPLTFTRQTTERIVADLNNDACGLTGSWDRDTLTFTATEAYNGDAFTEVVTPDALGHYTLDATWPWAVWQAELDQDEQHRAYARGALTPEEPADPSYSDAARAGWRRGRTEAGKLLQPQLGGEHRPQSSTMPGAIAHAGSSRRHR